MRQVVLDTETTGLETSEGHRIIEIGAVEIINRRITGNCYHQFLNPEREIDAGAIEVHGITIEELRDKPRFADVVQSFIEFVRGAELVIHNAPFDVGFLNYELGLLGARAPVARIEDCCTVLDTLALARELHPGQKNDLDSLCKRYRVDNSSRTRHGALLDAEILAEVYLAMTGGQSALFEDITTPIRHRAVARFEIRRLDPTRPRLPVIPPTAEELAAHLAWLEEIDRSSGGRCLWKHGDGTTRAE